MKKIIIIIVISLAVISLLFKLSLKFNLNSNYKVGQKLDSLNGVIVYYNGGVNNNVGRNLTADNYNLGIKYQCVEFVKRYYYQHLNHKMPDTHGNAKDFFDATIDDGKLNTKRDLLQFKNGSFSKPKANDLLIFNSTIFNQYGHVAIVSGVTENEVEIIQQNPGPFGKSRKTFTLKQLSNKWIIEDNKILGWLRKDTL